jgi:hypothetical protein
MPYQTAGFLFLGVFVSFAIRYLLRGIKLAHSVLSAKINR